MSIIVHVRMLIANLKELQAVQWNLDLEGSPAGTQSTVGLPHRPHHQVLLIHSSSTGAGCLQQLLAQAAVSPESISTCTSCNAGHASAIRVCPACFLKRAVHCCSAVLIPTG